MIRESDVSNAKKSPTLIVPGTESQAARRVAEAILARTPQNPEPRHEPRVMPRMSLTKEEVIEQQALQSMQGVVQIKPAGLTLPLTHGNRSMMDTLLPTPDRRWEIPTDDYVPLPLWKAGIDVKPSSYGWRIELCNIELGMQPLKFNILGDATIGRGREADIDLETYGVLAQAVSRRHVMLRPTDNHLHLIDLDSTNGTLFNGVLLSRCATHAIEHGDTVTLGRLSFTVRIIDSPYGQQVEQGIDLRA